MKRVLLAAMASASLRAPAPGTAKPIPRLPVAAAAAPTPTPAARPGLFRRWRPPPEWLPSAEQQERFRLAGLEAKAELDRLFLGKGPAENVPVPTLLEKIGRPLGLGPSDYWRESGWVEKTHGSWRLLVPGGPGVSVARFSRRGNPVVRVTPGERFKVWPTQSDLPSLDRHRDAPREKLTAKTRREPLSAVYNPEASAPALILKDGHHRFHSAARGRRDVFIELYMVRRDRPGEIHPVALWTGSTF